jgi:phosphoglycerol transferase
MNYFQATKLISQTYRTRDGRWLVAGGVTSITLALAIINGFRGIINETFRYPFMFSGDALLWLMQGKRVSEGWLYQNSRQGYPFGSNTFRYPGFDNAEFIVQKLLMYVGGFNYWEAMNVFIAITFPVCTLITQVVLKKLKCSSQIAFLGGLLYTFLPFHFYRFEHPTYVAYFVVPIYFLIGLRVYDHQTSNSKIKFSLVFRQFLLCLVLSTFGVYFTLFGLIFIGAMLLFGDSLQTGKRQFFYSLNYCIFLIVGLSINLMPSIWYMFVNRTSGMPDPVVRGRVEAEVFALKPLQLLLPERNHLINAFSNISEKYASSAPFVTENQGVSLGVVASIGLILAGYFLFRKETNTDNSRALRYLSTSVVFLLLVGTTGGLGTTLSYIGLRQIRAWNRISIFIAFGCIAVLCLVVQSVGKRTSNLTRAILIISILTLGLVDQAGGMYDFRTNKDKNEFDLSTEFIQQIEDLSPTGTAVYSLPYMTFPESGNSHDLETYQQGIGFLVSDKLRWNYGALKFSDGDIYFSELSKQSISTQIRVIKRIGFGGIYVDLRGFTDGGQEIVEEIKKEKSFSYIWRKDLKAIYFVMHGGVEPIEVGLGVKRIQIQSCFMPDDRSIWIETC